MMGGGVLLTCIFFTLLVFVILVIVGIGIWLYRDNLGRVGREPGERIKSSGSDPSEILRRRYANGEIPREEFDQMKRDLTG